MLMLISVLIVNTVAKLVLNFANSLGITLVTHLGPSAKDPKSV